MRRLPPLAALRAFEAAARHLSFRRAAAELAVTPTAISHQVRLLEATIGAVLFARRPRLVLTAAGQAIFPVMRDSLDAMAAAIAAIDARAARGAVTISATRAFTARWLVPRLPSFGAANPGLDLRLHAADEPVDLRSGVDAAIRYGSGTFPGLAAEELFRERFAPVASPRLRLRAPADLRRHTLIHFEWHRTDRDTPLWPRWLARAGLARLQPKAALTFSDESNAIQAAIAGQGVALLGLALVADELASGALVQPFGPVLPGPRCFLVYPREAGDTARIAAIRGWVHGEIAKRRKPPGPRRPAKKPAEV